MTSNKMTNETKKKRQTSLLSFFGQPKMKATNQVAATKSKHQPKVAEKDRQTVDTPNTASTNVLNASSPLVVSTDTRKQSVVSPDGPNNSVVARRNGTRKRPRPKAAAAHSNLAPVESTVSSRRKLKLRKTNSSEGEMKDSSENNQRQNTEEEQSSFAKPSSDTDESSDDSDSEQQMINEDGLSEYELLRLRNIARNNSRLAQLGLVKTESLEALAHCKNKPRRPRKTPSRTSKAVSVPTRRSTRIRRAVLDTSNTTNTSLNGASEESHQAKCKKVEEVEEEEETYTVSPLLQYAMKESNHEATTPKDMADLSKGVDNLSLNHNGPRLVGPKGLKAIYSLDFSGSSNQSNHRTWLVGAGKSGIVALWDCYNLWPSSDSEGGIDPTLTWKAHNGRWIAEARFLANEESWASRLLTAANDGKVCLWDLSAVSVRSGAPKRLSQSGTDLHSSGIFAMDVLTSSAAASSEIQIVTGSKDKTVALSVLGESSNQFRPLWRSNFHSAKVGAVRLHPTRTCTVASASDDGLVGIHDSKCAEKNGLVVELQDPHNRPHSVVWDQHHSELLMTAGLDRDIKIWDIRSTKEPLVLLHGHVPESTPRCQRIHHPAFYYPQGRDGRAFVLSGGDKSHALSMFHHDVYSKDQQPPKAASNNFLYSRGKLPNDCGDAGCIAVNDNDKVAVSVPGGEILILSPQHNCNDGTKTT